METARSKRFSKRRGVSYVHLVTLVVWIMRDGSLNQGKLRLPAMGRRIKSCESLWALVLLYYPGSGTGWWWDQIPHCRWGRCTGSCRRRSHTGPHRTAPSSSRTRSCLRKTGEEGVGSVKGSGTYALERARHGQDEVTAKSKITIFIITEREEHLL